MLKSYHTFNVSAVVHLCNDKTKIKRPQILQNGSAIDHILDRLHWLNVI